MGKNERMKEWGRSSLLTLVIGEQVPVNRRKISQNFSPAGVTSDRDQTSAGPESAGYDPASAGVPDPVDSDSCS